jgi:hypothetical protein
MNLDTNTPVPAANISATFNTLTNEVVFRFPGFSGGILPDGNYRATLGAGSLSDGAGNLLAPSAPLDFFVLSGDANRDRAVGFADLVAVAQNYGTPSGANFAHGDFNYDGTVGFADLVIVAQKYGTTLAAPVGASPVLAAAARAIDAKAPTAAGPIKTLFSVMPIAKPAPVRIKPVIRPRH